MPNFNRQETLILANCSSNRLSYLERSGLIIPRRIGSVLKPTCLFTWEQLIAIHILEGLQATKDLEINLRHAIALYLQTCNYDTFLHSKRLACVEEKFFWLDADWSDFASFMRQVDGDRSKSQVKAYTIAILPSLEPVIASIWNAAKSSPSIDFQSFKVRAKVRPQEMAIA